MRFFVPDINDATAEFVYQQAEKIAQARGFKASSRRVHQVLYERNGQITHAIVGHKLYGETVMVILEVEPVSSLYLAFRNPSGFLLKDGGPVFIGENEFILAGYFD